MMTTDVHYTTYNTNTQRKKEGRTRSVQMMTEDDYYTTNNTTVQCFVL